MRYQYINYNQLFINYTSMLTLFETEKQTNLARWILLIASFEILLPKNCYKCYLTRASDNRLVSVRKKWKNKVPKKSETRDERKWNKCKRKSKKKKQKYHQTSQYVSLDYSPLNVFMKKWRRWKQLNALKTLKVEQRWK